MSMFKPATKEKSRLRLALEGPSGSGKTYTALRVAHLIGGKIAVIDTENGSASKYLGASPDGTPWRFDVLNMTAPYSPDRYVEAIKDAEASGYTTIVIDSMSHMWSGKGGMLDLVNASGSSGNSFDGWRKCAPLERKFWDAILHCRIHLISCFRSKTEWVIEKDKNGKSAPRKVGMKADQRNDTEYEYDVALRLDDDHVATIIKTRCAAIDGETWQKPGASMIAPIMAWLDEGADPAPTPAPAPVAYREPLPVKPADAEPTPTQARALAAVRAEGLEDVVGNRYGLDCVTWSTPTLKAISQLVAESRAAKTRSTAEPAEKPKPAADVLTERRRKRVAECIEAGVLDAMRERHGDPDRWSHAACDAIKRELGDLGCAA